MAIYRKGYCVFCKKCRGSNNSHPKYMKCTAKDYANGEQFEVDEKGEIIISTDQCPDFEWRERCH